MIRHGDVDGDCDVDVDDYAALLSNYGKCKGDEGYLPCAGFYNDVFA